MFLQEKLKKYWKPVIHKEDKRKPYTDDKLSALLKEKGIPYSQKNSSQIQRAIRHTCSSFEKGNINEVT
jgi:RNA polymerase sigma-54 factor